MFITDQIYPFGYKATTVEKFTMLTVFAEAKNIKLKNDDSRCMNL